MCIILVAAYVGVVLFTLATVPAWPVWGLSYFEETKQNVSFLEFPLAPLLKANQPYIYNVYIYIYIYISFYITVSHHLAGQFQ